ncbi:unnamed protein product, partial [Heterobilharzia americana]
MPFFFGTTCKGEDHGLLDGLIIPISSMCSNSAFTARSCSGDNRRGFANTGGGASRRYVMRNVRSHTKDTTTWHKDIRKGLNDID